MPVMARRRLWLLVLPLSGGGILAGHAAAYRLLGGEPSGLHAYLAHVPHVLIALLLPAVVVAAGTGGPVRPRPWAFALLGLAGFATMEHLERLANGGLPWLLTNPVFLLGLTLQLPFALAAWWLARILLEPPPATRVRRLGRPALPLFTPVPPLVICAAGLSPASRGPPRPL